MVGIPKKRRARKFGKVFEGTLRGISHPVNLVHDFDKIDIPTDGNRHAPSAIGEGRIFGSGKELDG